MRANDIFISYSTKNQDIARNVRKYLEAHGITCWMAPESIPAGSNYTKEIPYGILNSKIAVLILSEDALHSIWVNQEVSYLLNADHIVIPYLVDNLDITSETIQEPFSDVISQQQPITHMGDSDSLNNLLSAVQHQLGRITTFIMPDNSDDLLQLGLQEIEEDGGMWFDKGKAEFYLTKSAEMGNAAAMRNLALLLTDKKDFEDAHPWWVKAAENGDLQAQIHEAFYTFNHSYGSDPELLKASKLLEQAIEENHPKAMCLQAQIMLIENCSLYNPQQAINLLEKSLDWGYMYSACILGDIYRFAKGVKKDPEKAFNYYKLASSEPNDDDDESLGSLRLADCYFEGFGTPKNQALAVELYDEYSEYSDEYLEKCGDCWYYGYGVKKDKEKALEAYQSVYLGETPDETLSSEIAMRVLKKLVSLGDEEAKNIMGVIKGVSYYNQGKYKQACQFLMKTVNDPATTGIGQIIRYLALCFYNGQGVDQNYKSAFLLFSKAFYSYDKESAKYLAECYEKGRGVEKDQVKADYFYDVVKQNKYGHYWHSILNKKNE